MSIQPTDPLDAEIKTELGREVLIVGGYPIASNDTIYLSRKDHRGIELPLKQICAILNTYSQIHAATLKKLKQQEADNDGNDTE